MEHQFYQGRRISPDDSYRSALFADKIISNSFSSCEYAKLTILGFVRDTFLDR